MIVAVRARYRASSFRWWHIIGLDERNLSADDDDFIIFWTASWESHHLEIVTGLQQLLADSSEMKHVIRSPCWEKKTMQTNLAWEYSPSYYSLSQTTDILLPDLLALARVHEFLLGSRKGWSDLHTVEGDVLRAINRLVVAPYSNLANTELGSDNGSKVLGSK